MYNYNQEYYQPFYINQMMSGYPYFNYQYVPMTITPIKMENIILPKSD